MTCFAQSDATRRVGPGFADSLRIVLENTRSLDATVVGATFSSAWTSIPIDQQITIQKQVRLMRRKKIALKPTLVNYVGAIAHAYNTERAENQKMAAFLQVVNKVLEKESGANIQRFFTMSRIFFQHHALYYDKTYRLYASDDNYNFEYIEPAAGFDLSSPAPGEEAPQPPQEELPAQEDDGYNDDAVSDTVFVDAPLWMSPPPPPAIEGPVIRFDKVTLNFVTRSDSVFLRNSSGVLSLRDYSFAGEKGKMDWTSAGLGPDIVECDVVVYYFKVNKPEFKSDLSKLSYKGKTPGFIPGILEFKSPPRKDSVLSTWPRFKSFQSNLQIENIADRNVRYTGGFSLIGNKVTGGSAGGEESLVEIYRDGQKKFAARSTEFIFNENSVISNGAQVVLQHRGDSISHPRVRFKYAFGGDTLQTLIVRKDKGNMKHTPYSSSYFNIDFAADVIRWNFAADSLNISIDGARNTVPLVIESTDYYDPEDYRILKGNGFSFHPVALIASYCLKNNIREFYSGDLVAYSGKEVREIKSALEFLSQKGLLFYNQRTDLVRVKEKLVLLYQGARGERDYDNLKILSVLDSLPNATVNYGKGFMTVRGVDEFRVSDSLNVRITPDSGIVTLLKNRDFKFDGTINAGNFEISGKGFTLKYDSFYIELAQIDSINFYVTEKNARGMSVRRKISNSMVGADSTAAAAGGLGDISRSSGTLFISRSNNKSGKLKIPNFPRLDASTGGVIYFDRPEVLDGAYDRSVFFVVPPFKLDSLNDADPASINFDGTFVSSGMFPSFKEKLHTQTDKSLGFTHNIPSTGYSLYQGDAEMTGAVSLDNRGIRGNGSIKFLAATVTSQDFIFYPDSVIGKGEEAEIAQKQFGSVVFPQANLKNFDMKWFPKQDVMKLKNQNAPFEFYNSTAQMRGTVTITKEGVGGIGKFETRGTELISREMSFSGTDFRARRARLKVKSEDPAKPLLNGTNVRMRFNLEQNYADISPEIAGSAAIDFPFAQFKTSIPNMRWDVSGKKITMRKEPDQPLEDSYFYTTRKDLDSLAFNAERAVYDLVTQELKVSGIPYIVVADARITPENNEVLILENARIGTLKNTTIILDTLNAYHRLTQGVVDIKSRKEFSGYATYQYVNFLGDTFAIKMTDFHLEPIDIGEVTRRSQKRKSSAATLQTVGTGSVTDKDFLVLGAGMYYKGDLTMFATRPALQLNGFVKLDIKKLKDYNTWIKYEQTGEETEVLIDFDKAVTEEGEKVNAGLHFGSNDNQLYITFVNKKKAEEDDDFFLPSGMLLYDTSSLEFKIEDVEKARGNKLSGKVFAYNDFKRQVKFEGPVKFFNGGKDFNINATAIGQGNMETSEIGMNSFLMMETNVPAAVFEQMAVQIKDVIKNEGADEGLGDQTELLYKIADLVGEQVVKDYEKRSLQGYVSLGTIPALAKPITFSNVQLKWSAEKKAFYSEGKLGISNINRQDINGAFEGFMEIRRNEDGSPVFHVFFKASPEAWYYFGFEDNRLLVHSSNESINGIVSKKTNAGKAKVGEVAFIPGTEEETLAFINRFRKSYYGIDVPYSLHDAAAPPSNATEAPPALPVIIPGTQDQPAQDQPVPDETTPDEPKQKPGKQKRSKKGAKETPAEETQPPVVPPPAKKETPPPSDDDGF